MTLMHSLFFRLFAVSAFLFGSAASKGKTSPALPVTPTPQSVRWQKGSFAWPDTLYYYSSPFGTMPTVGQLPLAVAHSRTANLRFTLDVTLPSEGYRLSIGKKRIDIAAADGAGAFYALQSLAQLAEHYAPEGSIPAVIITDAPRFPYRGLMLDVSRHFRDKKFVKRQLDLMARYKLNRFHWHLTDGAGWRIEIDRYPELTGIAAWRPYADWAAWNNGGRHYCRQDALAAQGGYYTKEDIREVVEYARQLHITVIPEIEMPGHSEEVLAVYPDLSCTKHPYTSSDFCVGSERTFEFLTAVLDEIIELFPSEYIHIGGDEASKKAWTTCPDCQKRMLDEGLSSTDELQSYLIRRIEQHLNVRGRKLLGWDEILEGGLAPNATVMSWRGIQGGIAAAQSGHYAVMSPGSHCYLDGCQDDPTLEPAGSAAILTLPTVYAYDPAPDSLEAAVRQMILGVQGNLWCEHVSTPEHCERMLWPRGVAVAEVGWTLPERKNYPDFLSRVCRDIPRLQSLGYHPFDQRKAVGSRPESRDRLSVLSTGKPVIYNTAYHKAYPAAGATTLTDGLRGGWSFGDRRWQGWLCVNADVTVDLEQCQPIARIAIDFLQGRAAEIWMPYEVEISVSEDGEHFTTLAVVPNSVPTDYAKSAYKTFSWSGQSFARYVRVCGRIDMSHGGWLFADEVVVE